MAPAFRRSPFRRDSPQPPPRHPRACQSGPSCSASTSPKTDSSPTPTRSNRRPTPASHHGARLPCRANRNTALETVLFPVHVHEIFFVLAEVFVQFGVRHEIERNRRGPRPLVVLGIGECDVDHHV